MLGQCVPENDRDDEMEESIPPRLLTALCSQNEGILMAL